MRFLAFELLFIFVIVILALTLFAQCLFGFLALAVCGSCFLLPFAPACFNLSVEAVALTLIILNELIELSCGNVDLVETFELAALELNGFLHSGEEVDLDC